LISCDGIPGSGKSWTSHFIALQIQRSGREAAWFYEEEPQHAHPVNVWDARTNHEFICRSLQRWRTFADTSQESPQISVLDSGFFLCPIGLQLFQHQAEPDEVKHYFQNVCDAVRILNPTLIYFYQESIEEALRTLARRRSPEWLDWFVEWTSNRPYSRTLGLQGFEGAVTFWRTYQDLTGELFAAYDMPRIAIEVSDGDWRAYRKRILDFLSLSEISDPVLSEHHMNQFVGTYTDTEGVWGPRHGATEIAIRLEEGRLYIYGLWWYRARLIPKGDRIFYVEGICLELHFEAYDDGTIRTMTVAGREVGAILGRTFLRKEEER